MDAATRAELDTLRVRAYGPAADIGDDPVAQARLEELEREIRAASGPRPDSPAPRPSNERRSLSEPQASRNAEPKRPEPPGSMLLDAHGVSTPRSARRGAAGDEPDLTRTATPRRWALVAGVAGVAVLAAVVVPRLLPATGEATGAAEPEASASPRVFEALADSDVILRIPIDGSFGSFQNLPSSGVAQVPALWDVRWADVLGEYYGFDLWIGEAHIDGSDLLCVVLATDDDGYVKSACGERRTWERTGLYVSVPYALIEPDERPDALALGERLGFWWTPTDSVLVLAGGYRAPRAAG